ncbi:MAG TPA: hypothetical protein ENJ29_11230 [Bacteroidetes bacterium]|nr:hypothetical protein [Bacteroidota bacterium]
MREFKEQRPFLYRMSYVVVKVALSIFFQKLDVRRPENIPKRGPVIFAANHPNSIMDALVLGVITKRKVNYIAHAGLFNNPVKAWFLRKCGVIPVYRKHEAPDKMQENEHTFEEARRVLERGEAIGIFPEGVSDMARKVQRLKTGTARILMDTEEKNDYKLGVKLVPVGLHFYSRSRFRSRVMANFGEAIELQPYFEQYKKEGFEAIRALTDAMQHELEKLTVNVQDEELDEFVRDIEVLYRDELKTFDFTDRKSREKAWREEFVISKAIAECVQYYRNTDPERVERLQERIGAYKRKLKRLRLSDNMLRESSNARDIWRQVFRTYRSSIPGLIPALYGIINNYIPYRISENIGRRFHFERTKILSALLLGGGMTFLLFYTLQTALVATFANPWWTAAYALSLPVSGFYALSYVTRLREQKKRLSFSFFLFTNKQLVTRMKRQRKQLIAEFDAVRDEYLNRMDIIMTPKAETAKNRTS